MSTNSHFGKQDILITKKETVFTTIDSIMAEFTPQDASYYPWIGWYLFSDPRYRYQGEHHFYTLL